MATVATQARKRDLEPHWRDALRSTAARFATRCGGALLIALAVALGIALATHSSTDDAVMTAAGGPPANWLGGAGAYTSDVLLLLFGLGSILFLPTIALAGIRLIRLRPKGRLSRASLVAA
ncbi:MAG: DNA translocase FtsK 4TM domain-containing protein, partial [Sphingomicrobium sp.]